MSRREPFPQAPVEDGAKVFWKSLADKENPEAAQRRAESEFSLGLEEAKASSIAAAASKLVRLRRSKDEPKQGAGDVAVGRRGFMFFAGATAALAAEGCARRPVEKIMPYSKAPEHVLPGVSTYYATVRQQRGDVVGLLVESHEGRPTKVEGNPGHPASQGATDLWSQAEIFELYDPDRATTPSHPSRTPVAAALWPEFDAAFADLVRSASVDGGAKLRVLAAPSTSPTFLRLLTALKKKLPQAKVHLWAPVNDQNAREGGSLAFGQIVDVSPRLSQASVVVAIDSDFLCTETGALRAAREFSAGRKLTSPRDTLNRLYAVEPTFTLTGMNADHRLRLPASQIEGYLHALAQELVSKHGIDLGPIAGSLSKTPNPAIPAKWVTEVAAELAGARAKSAILVGARQPATVHALAHALNAALGNVGHTIDLYPAGSAHDQDPVASIKELVADIERGAVGTLVILGGNPVYDAPADLKLGERLRSISMTVHFSSSLNETSKLCTWHAPRAHDLETWGDHRGIDGAVAIQQPLIAPLFGGRSDLEVLAKLAGEPVAAGKGGHDLVQETVKGSTSAATFSRVWNEALKKGVLSPVTRQLPPTAVRTTEVAATLAQLKAAPAIGDGNLEITFAPCGKLFDGRYANNPQLLELPDSVNKITWDNVATISKSTAQALGVENGSLIRLTREGAPGAVNIAVWITPGQADGSIGLVLGWGRTDAGRYGDRRGFDVGPLRTSDAQWIATGVKAAKLSSSEVDAIKGGFRKVGMAATESPVAGRVRPDDPIDVNNGLYKISQTQEHDTMEGRPLAIDATLEEYRANAHFPMFPNEVRKDLDQHGKEIGVRGSGSPDPSTMPLWERVDYSKGHKWGMVVDLTSCTGCNACIVACHIENNVPAVGKEMVWRGREMAWLRVDRYFVGLDPNDPQVAFQPVSCMQCEEAPCENVCPVNATEHSPEGLNDMAYNRCIGTRYCANNCPYKVRRFNFLNYHTSGGSYDDVPELEKMRANPNVTVRMRGVMEKCTYCVQRIQEAKIKARREGRQVKDGDVVVACQQACGSDCVTFGDLNDPESKVSKARALDRSYRLLAELGTHPRTSYLGKIRNPNPKMAG